MGPEEMAERMRTLDGIDDRQVESYFAALQHYAQQRHMAPSPTTTTPNARPSLSFVEYLLLLFRKDLGAFDGALAGAEPGQVTLTARAAIERSCAAVNATLTGLEAAAVEADLKDRLKELGVPTRRIAIAKPEGESLGIQLRESPGKGKHLMRVSHIKRLSSAAACGLRKGDLIVAVDHRLMLAANHADVGKAIKQCGTQIVFHVTSPDQLAEVLDDAKQRTAFHARSQELCARPAWNGSTMASCVVPLPVDTVPFGNAALASPREYDVYGAATSFWKPFLLCFSSFFAAALYRRANAV